MNQFNPSGSALGAAPSLGNPMGLIGAQPIRENHVPAEMNQAREAMAENARLVEELTRRLEPVLRQSDKEPGVNGKVPEELLVPVAECIRDISKQIGLNNRTLASILSRLEI